MADGINIIGTLTGAVGTVVAANMVVEALRRGGIPLAGYDLVTDTHGRLPLQRPPIPMVNRIEDLPYKHSLFLDVMPSVWRALHEHTEFFQKQRRAFVFYYELKTIPLDWRPLINTFDVLFAPSTFVADSIMHSIQRESSPIPVVPLIDRPARRQRASGERFKVLYTFDPLSAEDRKNPRAGFNAFSQAFAGRDDAELLLKVWHNKKFGCEIDMNELVGHIHPNIRLIENDLTYDQNLDLEAEADCYLSLHRGEGLGLSLLESMALGTSVIATNYGGSCDFVDSTTGIPVPYHLVTTATRHSLFTKEMLGEEGFWAEADVGYAAGALQWLAEHPEQRQQLSDAAHLRYLQRRAQFLALDWLEPFLERPRARTSVFSFDPQFSTTLSRNTSNQGTVIQR
jgi:glycosyltransferase involved in cell wall biosynthesis